MLFSTFVTCPNFPVLPNPTLQELLDSSLKSLRLRFFDLRDFFSMFLSSVLTFLRWSSIVLKDWRLILLLTGDFPFWDLKVFLGTPYFSYLRQCTVSWVDLASSCLAQRAQCLEERFLFWWLLSSLLATFLVPFPFLDSATFSAFLGTWLSIFLIVLRVWELHP